MKKIKISTLLLLALPIIMSFASISCTLPEEFQTFEVISYYPDNGSRGNNLSTQVSMEFNTGADKKVVEEMFSLSDDSETIRGTFNWVSSKKFFFEPDSDLDNSTRYKITLSKSARDKSGNKMNMDFISDFYVGNDLLSPEVISSTPIKTVGGTMNVPVDQNIIIDFSEPMDIEKTGDAFSISPDIAGYMSWSNSNTTMTYNITEDLQYGKQYKISLSNAAEDSSANSLAETYTVIFTTGDDFTKPELLSTYNGANPLEVYDLYRVNENISKTASISFEFNEEMNKNSVESAISISPSISGEFSWSGVNNSTIVTFTPEENLNLETIYTIEIASSAKDLNSNSMEESLFFSIKTNADDSQFLKIKNILGRNEDSNTVADYTLLYDASSPTSLPLTIDMGSGGAADYKDYYFLIEFYQSDISTAVELDIYSAIDNINADVFAASNEPSLEAINIIGTTYLKVKLNSMANKDYEINYNSNPGYSPFVYSLSFTGSSSGILDVNCNYMKEDFYFEFCEN